MAKPKNTAEPIIIRAKDPSLEKGELRQLGGSRSDLFNNILVRQTVSTLWLAHAKDHDEQVKLFDGAAAALMGISPKDELEGMLAAQMIAAHSAAIECFRRAMLEGQTFEGRRENLNQANRLSKTYAALLEALNRHRGKGQQKITVERVNVQAGGQAIVGTVETGGGGVSQPNQGQPHAKSISHAPVTPLWSENQGREPVPVTGHAERALPDTRW